MYLKKQDLDHVDWELLVGFTDVELEEFAQTHLQPHQQWLLPQMVANFGQWTLAKQGDRILVKETIRRNCKDDPKQQGLWRLTRVPRSQLIKSQTQQPEYAQFTPLIMMGFKRFQGVQYEQWRGLDDLDYIMEPRLLDAVCVECPGLGSDELLEIRNQGLMNKTGQKAGSLKPAESTWSLTGVRNTAIGHLPKLTQTMLTQIWLAHPSKRTSYMILDPTNWDRMPEPLISMELFESTNKAVEQFKSQKHDKLLPWL
jgi:hypothetical protein